MRPTFLTLLLMSCCSFAYGQTVRLEPGITTATPSVVEARDGNADRLADLRRQLEVAAPDERFSIDLQFVELPRLQAVQAAVTRLEIQRVLAFVMVGANTRGIGLGTFYDGLPAWQHGVCGVLVSASFSGHDVEAAPERWPVSSLVAYGSAHALRELSSGVYLPAAHLTGGSRQQARHDRRFRDAVRQEVEQPFHDLPAGYSPPEICAPFIRPSEYPILMGNHLRLSEEERYMAPDELIHKQLSNLAGNVPLTMTLVFENSVSIEALGTLVASHRIDGMSAELKPSTGDRMVSMAELSIHGSEIADQVRRTHCVLAASSQTNPEVVWRADSARVSLSVQRAWQVLSDPAVGTARLDAVFAPEDLQRVVRYFEKQASQPAVTSHTRRLQTGCEAYLMPRSP